MRVSRYLFILAFLLPLTPALAQDTDPVVLKFAVMGGCRVSYKDWLKTREENPSSANLPQLQQTLSDLAQLPDGAPSLFFLTGDWVNNEVADGGQVLLEQLNAWIDLVSKSALWKMSTFVVMPGNHEMLKYVPKPKPYEVPNPPCYPIYLDWLERSGLNKEGGNGPKEQGANPDLLVGDQSHVTFSFNRQGIHFVVLNTDSLSRATDDQGNLYAGWIPINWIRQDFAAAQLDPSVKMIIALGHKPLKVPKVGEGHTPIVNFMPYNYSEQLSDIFVRNSKFKAYLTGHEHLWEARHIDSPNSPWEIIIGNGGSDLNKSWRDGEPYFGFTVLKLYQSGKLGLINYRRPYPKAPQKYFQGPAPAAQPDAEITL